MRLKLKRYLGDGVYAGFDGFQIWIWTDNGAGVNSAHGFNFIALEPGVLASLKRYDADLAATAAADLDREQL